MNPCCGGTFGFGLDCLLSTVFAVVLFHDGQKIVFGNRDTLSWHQHKWPLRPEKPNSILAVNKDKSLDLVFYGLGNYEQVI